MKKSSIFLRLYEKIEHLLLTLRIVKDIIIKISFPNNISYNKNKGYITKGINNYSISIRKVKYKT